MPTALIVEDEPSANDLLSRLVQLRGFATDSAYNGHEAIDKARAGRPDLVFLDLMLPDIDGYEVCQALKNRRATTTIPVVMVTARLSGENRLEGFRAGASDYIAKPYTPDQIFGALAQADAWRREVEALDDGGSFALDAREDVAHLRRATDLRSLLLERTSLDEDAVARLGSALGAILQRGVDWARTRGKGRVATLDVRLDPARFSLAIRDESGWLGDDDPRRDGLARLIEDARFDEVDFREGSELRMVRGLPGG